MISLPPAAPGAILDWRSEMNIKSLLLGSAAALVAVSGARAADVIVADPEPVEYVRVCDAYGTGFFYIPGTETCIKIGGYVRYQIDVARRFTGGVNINPAAEAFAGLVPGSLAPLGINVFNAGAEEWGWTKNTRGQLEFDVREETEFGTLRGFIALQGNSNPAVTRTVGLDAAYIELGGLHMGVSDNAFDGGINGETDILGGAKVNRIAYTFSSGAFDATLSIDDDNGGGKAGLPDFAPNFSANVGGTFGPASVRLYGAYDNQTDEVAIKGIVGIDVTSSGHLDVAAYYTSGATYVFSDTIALAVDEALTGATPDAYVAGVPAWGEWSVQASYMHTFNPLATSAGYIDNLPVPHSRHVQIGADINAWLDIGDDRLQGHGQSLRQCPLLPADGAEQAT
ncbi:MAG: porin [Brucellaceae bacterium]|nr:porin [Brucellaceae bacterium]